jgi:hypothetical protein
VMTNRVNPTIRNCSLCKRRFTHVRGWSESTEVCGVCLARRGQLERSTKDVPSKERREDGTIERL